MELGTLWVTIAIILAIIALIVLGILYDEDEDGDGFIVIKAMLAIIFSGLWPLVLAILLVILVLCAPIYLGRGIRLVIKKYIEGKKKKKKQRLDFIDEIQKLKKNIKQ